MNTSSFVTSHLNILQVAVRLPPCQQAKVSAQGWSRIGTIKVVSFQMSLKHIQNQLASPTASGMENLTYLEPTLVSWFIYVGRPHLQSFPQIPKLCNWNFSSDAQFLAATVQVTPLESSSHTEGKITLKLPSPPNTLKFPSRAQKYPKFPNFPSRTPKYFPPMHPKYPNALSLNPPSSVSEPALLRPKWPKA